jgi:hypothetical protein
VLRNARRCGDATNGNVVKLGALAGRASAKAQSYAPAAWPRMVGQPASSSPWHPVANTGDRPSGILSTTVKFRLSLVQGVGDWPGVLMHVLSRVQDYSPESPSPRTTSLA